MGLRQQLQLSPSLCYLPGGVQRGPGRLQAWLLVSISSELLGCGQAELQKELSSLAEVGGPWAFSFSSS